MRLRKNILQVCNIKQTGIQRRKFLHFFLVIFGSFQVQNLVWNFSFIKSYLEIIRTYYKAWLLFVKIIPSYTLPFFTDSSLFLQIISCWIPFSSKIIQFTFLPYLTTFKIITIVHVSTVICTLSNILLHML